MRERVAAEERLRQALAVALHECLPDTADDRMHPTDEDADEPFCEYLSHALIARITEPTWLAQNDLPDAAAQADTAPGGGLREAAERVIDWADKQQPWNPSGDFDSLYAALGRRRPEGEEPTGPRYYRVAR